MEANSRKDVKARVGDIFPTLELTAASGRQVTIPDPGGDRVHLQLRRFAGCPICNLHLRTIVTRHDEIRSHGIREVVVFHSTAKELAKHEAEMPFALIPDPERALYRQLGVERGPSSLLSRGALHAAKAGEERRGAEVPQECGEHEDGGDAHSPPPDPRGHVVGLPEPSS